MFQITKFILLISFFTTAAFSQDIISADGHNMGPRKYFLEVCAGDVDTKKYREQGYSTLDFCNCLSEKLITKLTKKEINYYFAQNNHIEIYKDTSLSRIAMACMIDAQRNWNQPPPPQKIITEHTYTRKVLIDSIVSLADYELKFNEILEARLQELTKEQELSNAQLEKLRENIRFDEIRIEVIKNAYSDYSHEDIETICEYLGGMTPEELGKCTVRHEQIMIDYFTLLIENQVNDELKEN